ncbi:MAG: tRNA lysidine(34) synthetase TilS [bacterium]|nr:tRNA lysidine(34) synthetase TilS [bacterium]
MLLSNVAKTIAKYQLFQSGDKVVIGVSGGPDSIALLYCLNELREEYQLKLIIAHLNHQIRGKEADADARFVQSLAKKLQFPCFVKSVNVPALAKKEKKSLEETARQIRYAFLWELAVKKQANKIALGHTADDQIETIVMWFLRGSGPEGLSGMPVVRQSEVPSTQYQTERSVRCKCKHPIYIIRPLLETSRKEILEYLNQHKISFRQDTTNLKPIYLRNRIRLKLLPLLEKEYNPNLRETLLRTATILRDEQDYFNSAANMLFPCLWNRERTDCIALNITELRRLDKAIHRHLVRQAIERVLGSLSGFGFEHIEAILELVKSGGDGLMLHLPHQLTVRIEQDHLCFYLEHPIKKTIQPNKLIAVPGTTQIETLGIKIKTELRTASPSASAKIRLNQNDIALLDADRIQFPLTLRTWQPGDIFFPLGMTGKKKLHDFFIDEKVPRTQRDKIPLIVAKNGDILWVVGKRINEKYKVTSGTKRILRITFT